MPLAVGVTERGWSGRLEGRVWVEKRYKRTKEDQHERRERSGQGAKDVRGRKTEGSPLGDWVPTRN